jgi:RNA polymerase sigma-70 factor (ECF subfamily)
VDAPAAFRRQLLDSIPRLRRYARTLVFDHAAADDLTQTALERALTHWRKFDQRRSLLAWLLSIAHNAHLDGRRRDVRLTVTDPDELKSRQEQDGDDAGPDLALRFDLLRALARLPVEQREALVLVCVEQFSYAEVAEVMQIPIGTVMSRVSRARASLRRLLEGGTWPNGPALRRVV